MYLPNVQLQSFVTSPPEPNFIENTRVRFAARLAN
jgi:hypothetical protein